MAMRPDHWIGATKQALTLSVMRGWCGRTRRWRRCRWCGRLDRSADLQVGHAIIRKLAAIGFDVNVARTHGADRGVDRNATEKQIARTQDVDMQRIGEAIGDLHIAGTGDVDMHRTIDA